MTQSRTFKKVTLFACLALVVVLAVTLSLAFTLNNAKAAGETITVTGTLTLPDDKTLLTGEDACNGNIQGGADITITYKLQAPDGVKGITAHLVYDKTKFQLCDTNAISFDSEVLGAPTVTNRTFDPGNHSETTTQTISFVWDSATAFSGTSNAWVVVKYKMTSATAAGTHSFNLIVDQAVNYASSGTLKDLTIVQAAAQTLEVRSAGVLSVENDADISQTVYYNGKELKTWDTHATMPSDHISKAGGEDAKFEGNWHNYVEYQYSGYGKTGAGEVTFAWKDSEDVPLASAPTNAGTYTLTISAAAGDLFTAAEDLTISVTIRPYVLGYTADDLVAASKTWTAGTTWTAEDISLKTSRYITPKADIGNVEIDGTPDFTNSRVQLKVYLNAKTNFVFSEEPNLTTTKFFQIYASITVGANSWTKELPNAHTHVYDSNTPTIDVAAAYGSVTFQYSINSDEWDYATAPWVDGLPVNAGSYRVRARVLAGEGYQGLEWTTGTLVLTISKCAIRIVPDDVTQTYGDTPIADADLTYKMYVGDTNNEFANDHVARTDFTITLAKADPGNYNAGDHYITATRTAKNGVVANNYSFNVDEHDNISAKGTYSIAKKKVSESAISVAALTGHDVKDYTGEGLSWTATDFVATTTQTGVDFTVEGLLNLTIEDKHSYTNANINRAGTYYNEGNKYYVTITFTLSEKQNHELVNDEQAHIASGTTTRTVEVKVRQAENAWAEGQAPTVSMANPSATMVKSAVANFPRNASVENGQVTVTVYNNEECTQENDGTFVGGRTYYVVFAVAGTNNYTALSDTIPLVMGKLEATKPVVKLGADVLTPGNTFTEENYKGENYALDISSNAGCNIEPDSKMTKHSTKSVYYMTNVGEYTLTITLNEGYTWQGETGEAATQVLTYKVKIKAVTLTLTLQNLTLAYGDAVPTNFTVTANGLVGNDTNLLNDVDWATYCATTYTATTPAGTSGLKVKWNANAATNLAANVSPNYNYALNEGTATVAEATITNDIVAYNHTYDGAAHPIIASGGAIVKNGQTVTATYYKNNISQGNSMPTVKDVADTAAGVVWTVVYSADNHKTTAPIAINAYVGKIAIKVKADDKTSEIGQELKTLTFTVSKAAGTTDDQLTLAQSELTASCFTLEMSGYNASSPKAGTYTITITPTGAACSNYDFTDNLLTGTYTLSNSITWEKSGASSYVYLTNIQVGQDKDFYATAEHGTVRYELSYGEDNEDFDEFSEWIFTADFNRLKVGTWNIRAVVDPEKDEYNGATSTTLTFTVTPATLSTPTITVYAADAFSWKDVTTVVETIDNMPGAAFNNLVYKVNGEKVDDGQFPIEEAGTYTLVVSGANFTSSSATINAYNVFYTVVPKADESKWVATELKALKTSYALKRTLALAGGTVTLATPEKTDSTTFEFKNWKIGATPYAAGAGITITDSMATDYDIEIVGVWEVITYTVTWVVKGETVKTENVAYGTAIEDILDMQAAPEDYQTDTYSYTFSGWTCTPAYDILEGPMTIIADFKSTIRTYTLTFIWVAADSAKTETIISSNDQVAVGTTGLTAPALATKSWFTPTAWHESTEDGKALFTSYNGIMPAKNVTFYSEYVFTPGLGDVNGDGKVDVDDINVVRKYIVGGYAIEDVAAGTEWTYVQTNGYGDGQQKIVDSTKTYLLRANSNVYDDSNLDIRDVAMLRMAITGGYGLQLKGTAGVDQYISDGGEIAESTTTIYYYNNENKSDLHVHAFNDTENNGWGGAEMTAVAGHDGWFSAEIPTKYTKVIFNNNLPNTNGNAWETATITLDPANRYYCVATWVDSFTTTFVKAGNNVYSLTFKEGAGSGTGTNHTGEYQNTNMSIGAGDTVLIVIGGGVRFDYKEGCRTVFSNYDNKQISAAGSYSIYIDDDPGYGNDGVWISKNT